MGTVNLVANGVTWIEECEMTDRPTITVDLETLEKALKRADDGSCVDAIIDAVDELRRSIEQRRRELNMPAPGPWFFDRGENYRSLVDANENGLGDRDMKRAAMAPELADFLRHAIKDMKKTNFTTLAGELLARFDDPEGSE